MVLSSNSAHSDEELDSSQSFRPLNWPFNFQGFVLTFREFSKPFPLLGVRFLSFFSHEVSFWVTPFSWAEWPDILPRNWGKKPGGPVTPPTETAGGARSPSCTNNQAGMREICGHSLGATSHLKPQGASSGGIPSTVSNWFSLRPAWFPRRLLRVQVASHLLRRTGGHRRCLRQGICAQRLGQGLASEAQGAWVACPGWGVGGEGELGETSPNR